MDYKSAGVDVEAGRAFVERIRSSVEATHRPEVVGGLGGFGGMMRLPAGMRQPLLVSGTDGVGTKLELAQEHEGHHDVGIDLVAMCVNDVITSGAEPLFFLDYMATGALSPEAMAQVVEGVAEGCRRSGCALLGGETAEMPGFYPAGRYDLAGFCVAVVEADEVIDGSKIGAGDKVIGVASSGVHSNGYSLVRRVLEAAGADHQTCYGADQRPLIRDLLKPTRLYPDLVQTLLRHDIAIHGMAHITGGGIPENLPRCLPANVSVQIEPDSWPRPPLFDWLQQAGEIPERDLWHTFNMGVGYCLVVPEQHVEQALHQCADSGHLAWCIGAVTPRDAADQPALLGLPA
ncbi:phosphoribosylformylglycinamidine cyclo-ligase [Parasynechococcus sp.]|uniref:phosphoribosylformylglycinamidine cyclo-ligase n=1 Tax=Parasynechococcus sp. TaxID=3101203 RepID=UPI003704A7F4